MIETEATSTRTDAGDDPAAEGFVLTGIDGLDEMLGRGVPAGHIITVLGSFGTGKTTFALQFLMQGLINGEKGIFISLEEDTDSVVANAASFGWDLPKFIKEKKLHIVKLEPADAKTTVTRIRSELPDFIKRIGASRVAIDSISLLNMLFADDKERREKLFLLCKQLKSTGATCVFTAEVKDENPRSSRDGLVEYVSDGVIGLRFNERENGEVQLVLQIIKMRRLKHPRSVKPYSITEQGLEVHGHMEVFCVYEPWTDPKEFRTERLSLARLTPVLVRVGILLYDGVEELDAVGVYEVLAKAKQLHPKLDLTVRFRAMKEEIAGALGMKFLAHEVLRDLSDLDLVIVPGGAGRAEVMKDREFLSELLNFGTEKPIASVCTGALILAAAGLLAGRKATTHRSFMDELRTVADVVEDRVVEDGLVTTAGGVTASIDLGLHLLEKHFGPELAREVEDRIEYHRHPNP